MAKTMRMPEVKPEIVFIFELVQEVAIGKVRIPNFQRPYVWRREQMLALLDSVYRQYPIGSLLVWETDTRLSSRNQIGPVPIPVVDRGVATHVLDGHQRLSTLAGVLMSPKGEVAEDEDPERWHVWFDAKNQQFEHLKPGHSPEPWLFPMWKLMDTVDFLNESHRILSEGGDAASEYVQTVQELARRFQAYKIPVIRIKNTELSQAVEVFARLNSEGQAMTADQMVSALMYREDEDGEPSFNLSKHIDEILEELDGYGFGGIKRVVVLRTLLAVLGEDIYRTDWTRLTDAKKSNLQAKLPEIVDDTRKALVAAAGFLGKIGVHNHRLLPYAMQLVVLGVFYKACPKPNSAQKSFLERWFWVSSFTGWFASGNPSRVGTLVNEFRDRVAVAPSPQGLDTMRLDDPAQAFPANFDMRSARTKSLLLVTLSLHPRDKNGVNIEAPWDRIGRHGPNAIGYVAATVRDKSLASSPANRILKLDLKDRSQAKNWLVNLEKIEQSARIDVLRSHAIPEEAFPLLQKDDNIGFLQARKNYLIEIERRFMRKKGVVEPVDREARLAPIDSSDE